MSISNKNQADVIEAFHSTPKYLDTYSVLITLISNKWYSTFLLLSVIQIKHIQLVDMFIALNPRVIF